MTWFINQPISAEDSDTPQNLVACRSACGCNILMWTQPAMAVDHVPLSLDPPVGWRVWVVRVHQKGLLTWHFAVDE